MIKVYLSQYIPQPILKVQCDERNKYILSMKSEKSRLQSFKVWQLLEWAMQNRLGMDVKSVNFFCDANGKWGCDKLYFSLSHTQNRVAVALSDVPVGIDIQSTNALQQGLPIKRLAEKLLTYKELQKFNAIPSKEKSNFFLSCWTRRESLLKLCGNTVESLNKTANQAADGNKCQPTSQEADGNQNQAIKTHQLSIFSLVQNEREILNRLGICGGQLHTNTFFENDYVLSVCSLSAEEWQCEVVSL